MSTNPAKTDVTMAQEMRQTDLGRFIYENKTIVITLLLLALVGGIGTFSMKQIDLKEQKNFDAKATDIRKNELAKYEKGEIETSQLISRVSSLLSAHEGKEYTGPFLLEVSKLLHDKKQYGDVITLLSSSVSSLRKSKQVYFLLNLQLAVSYEDNQNFSESVDVLNTLTSLKILEEKIYFDLGRLYKKLNDVEKSKTSFEYVTANFPNSDYAKLATYYLSQL